MHTLVRRATQGVAAHRRLPHGRPLCDWLPEAGITGSQLWVTFDSEVAIDPETFAATATNWHQATFYAVDPAAGRSRSNPKDYAVIVLGTTVDINPVRLPSAGLLDRLAARGALRPDAKFENVGYGLIPSFKMGPPRYELPAERMRSMYHCFRDSRRPS